MATNNSINSRELIKTNNLSDLTNAGTARTNLGLGSAAVVATDLADLNEATIESAIDTLANLTSIQGQTMSFSAPLTIPADPNADRILFWDDSAGGTAWLTVGSGLSITGTTITASGGSPGGSDTQVQFNDGGAFGGDAQFTWNKTTNTLKVITGGGTSLSIVGDTISNDNGSDLTINSSVGGVDSSGGTLFLSSGDGNGTGNGGSILATSGNGGATGNGGTVQFTGGSGGATSGNGGNVFFLGGNAQLGNSDGGDIVFQAGIHTGSGTPGTFRFSPLNATTVDGILDFDSLGTTDKTFTFQNLTGTLAMFENNLSVFSATSSAELAGVISDETGSGALMFATSPTITTDITIPNTGLHLLDTNASHDLIIAPGSDLTADRTLTLTTGDSARTITLSGNPTLADWFDQSVKTTANPQFATIELGAASDTTLARASAGQVNIEGVQIATISNTVTLSNKTLTAPRFADLGFIADNNGNELIILDTVTSAVNEVTFANAATGANPNFSATGGDTNVGIDFTPKGTGFIQIKGNSTQAGTLAIYEDTDDGSNYSAFRGSARSGNIIYTMPTADPTAGQVLSAGAPSGGVSALSWATAGGGGGGWAFESYNTATNSASITISSLDLETDLAYQVVYETIADSGTNHEVQMTVGGTGLGTYVFGLSWQKQVGASGSSGTSGSNSLGYWRLQTETTRSCQGTLLLTKGTNTTGEPLIMMRGSTGGYSTDTALTTSVSGVNEATTVTSITLTASAGTPNWKVWVFRAATS